MSNSHSKLLAFVGPLLMLSGCVATAVAGAAISTTGNVIEGGVNAGVKTVGVAVDVVTPDGDDED